MQELFNLRHASARNCVERIFGILKNRWRILLIPSSYPMSVQAQVVTGLCALHNFIRYCDPHELRGFNSISQSYNECFGVAVEVPQAELGSGHVSAAEKTRSEVFRDAVAEEMWAQYQSELLRRRQRQARNND